MRKESVHLPHKCKYLWEMQGGAEKKGREKEEEKKKASNLIMGSRMAAFSRTVEKDPDFNRSQKGRIETRMLSGLERRQPKYHFVGKGDVNLCSSAEYRRTLNNLKG